MNIVSFGGGTNSTALLIECVKRGIEIDLILFADTGGERPHTYKYKALFNKWLKENGMPEIVTVQQVNQYGTAITLEQICLNLNQLPSLAYGFKSCSQKHKIAPQDKYLNNWKSAKDVWNRGEKITKFIGYDADEHHRIQADYSDNKYNFRYPLVEWEMGRKECVKTIEDAGLPQPLKSSCFFCPSNKPHEIHELNQNYPKLMDRALAMERGAKLTKVKGLGRGYAWSDVIKQDDFLGFDLPPELDCGCYDGK